MLFFKNLWSSKTLFDTNETMKKFLIVGLGNIGDQYANTRHNIGFKVLEALAASSETTFESNRFGQVALAKYKGRQMLCLKPDTYMNLSGNAVRFWLEKEKIHIQNLLVVTDDLNLPFGTLRLKSKGSDGGHNGLKDIQSKLGTTIYPRLRFGVGADFAQGKQVDYVLGNWNQEEQNALDERLARCVALIQYFVFGGIQNTMNQFNGT